MHVQDERERRGCEEYAKVEREEGFEGREARGAVLGGEEEEAWEGDEEQGPQREAAVGRERFKSAWDGER